MKILNEIINKQDCRECEANALSVLAYCTCFLAAPVKSAEGWRVIAEDLRFHRDRRVLLRNRSAIQAPADPAKSDCTPAIQRALDASAGRWNGFLPEGKYRLEGMLTIASNVILRTLESDRSGSSGRWNNLMIHNQEHEQSVLIKGSGCGVRDLTFWHPEQQITDSTGPNALAESPLRFEASLGGNYREYQSHQSRARHRSLPGEHLLLAWYLW